MDSTDTQAETDGYGGRRTHRAGEILALLGALLQAGFLIATAGLIVATTEGPPKEREILPDLRGILPFLLATVAGLVGLVLLAIALLGTRYRARWFFWFLTTYGVVLTVAGPLVLSAFFGVLTVGIVPFGPVFLIYGLVRKRDFFPRRRQRFL